jgi:hypothetical protein
VPGSGVGFVVVEGGQQGRGPAVPAVDAVAVVAGDERRLCGVLRWSGHPRWTVARAGMGALVDGLEGPDGDVGVELGRGQLSVAALAEWLAQS